MRIDTIEVSLTHLEVITRRTSSMMVEAVRIASVKDLTSVRKFGTRHKWTPN